MRLWTAESGFESLPPSQARFPASKLFSFNSLRGRSGVSRAGLTPRRGTCSSFAPVNEGGDMRDRLREALPPRSFRSLLAGFGKNGLWVPDSGLRKDKGSNGGQAWRERKLRLSGRRAGQRAQQVGGLLPVAPTCHAASRRLRIRTSL